MITVVGLGYETGDLTVKGRRAIASAERVFCRTFLTPVTRRLKNKGAVSFDPLYDKAADFDELNRLICGELTAAGSTANVVYCVRGDGYSDGAVRLLHEQGAQMGIIGGVADSGAELPSGGAAAFDAYTVTLRRPFIDTNFALSVREIDNVLLAGELKLALLESYPAQAVCRYSYNGKVSEIALENIDKQKRYNFSSSVFIPALTPFDKNRYCFADLLEIMRRLTAVDGCEWDKVQTHKSIRINLIEEAYEAVDAIDCGDIDAMIEETGDVLLQAVFHSDIAARSGEFTFGDVIDRLCTKLITRHTHIFGENTAENAAQALGFWEKAKAKEKNQRSISDVLDSIPDVFPSALKAEKLFKKSLKAGLTADYSKVRAAIDAAADSGNFGELLFLCTAVAALKKHDAEVELNNVCRRFVEACKSAKTIENTDFLTILHGDNVVTDNKNNAE